jgi:peptidoglycan L-alanyl-D-glutamate endopeptidase CwlK
MKLTPKDREKLKGLHPDLVRVIERAAEISDRPFVLLEGKRTLARQKQLLAQGATTTLNSRHLTGHAIDLAPLGKGGKVSWDWPLYYPLAKIIKQAAKEENVPFEWGGDWKKFPDGPHWQLPWKQYPAQAKQAEAREQPPMNPTKNTLANSRIVQGSAVSAAGGAAVMADMADSLMKADGTWSTGTWIGIVAGLLIISGALYALYARWDDAGRPALFGGD